MEREIEGERDRRIERQTKRETEGERDRGRERQSDVVIRGDRLTSHQACVMDGSDLGMLIRSGLFDSAYSLH
jgi:hypothetical protein